MRQREFGAAKGEDLACRKGKNEGSDDVCSVQTKDQTMMVRFVFDAVLSAFCCMSVLLKLNGQNRL